MVQHNEMTSKELFITVEANKKALKEVIKPLNDKGWKIKYKKIRFEKVCGVWKLFKGNVYTITIQL